MSDERFEPSWWLRGGHLQTLWPAFARKGRLDVVSERLPLPDGDVARLDWLGHAGPTVIVLPGLQGDLHSGYVRRLLRACAARGWRGVLLNHRGRGEPNRLPHSYHCGMTCDLDHLVRRLHEREPATPIAVVGYSLGANICLKWLGEAGRRGDVLPVVAAVAVAAPFHLGPVAKHIESGFARLYQWHLLKSLRRDVARKIDADHPRLALNAGQLRRLNTFYKFDDRLTAPLHGFRDAAHYYEQTRTDLLLRHVAVPTLILNARNDPLVPAHLIPPASEVSEQVTLEISETGGHMGYVCGRWPWRARFWLDTRIPAYLAPFFGG